MIPLTVAAICELTGAELHLPSTNGGPTGDGGAGTVVDGPVTTDSRECGPGSLYVARVGETADGHDYAPAAVAAGAVAVLGSRPVEDVPTLVVDDVQTAFGRVARGVLDRAESLRVVGITGSSGKTSTKDLLASVLATAGETVAPLNSLNGEIGVPLTVCRITPTTRFLVVEMGARGMGHIEYLTRIAPPSIGIVLNVGTAHVGEFGSRENIARAKAELPQALPADGLAVLNQDDPVVAAMAEGLAARVCRVGQSDGADIRATQVSVDSGGRAAYVLETPEGSARVALQLVGAHHVGNSLAVAAAALELGMPLDDVAAALSTARASSRWRMEVTERPDGVTVVNDAYNANPDSARAALRALRSMGTPGRRVAVLGEMLELGPDAESEHAGVRTYAAELGIDEVVAVGDGARAYGADRWLPDLDSAETYLNESLQDGDVVLLKSSRDSGLRWLGDRLAAAATSPADDRPAASPPTGPRPAGTPGSDDVTTAQTAPAASRPAPEERKGQQ